MHLRWQTVVLLLANIASGIGCASPTAPELSTEVTLQVARSGSPDAPAGAVSPPAIVVEGQRVVVLGLMPTPSPCQIISASRTLSGNQVTFRLATQPASSGCVTVLGEFAYRAATQLARGTYLVKVVHEYPGTGWPTVIAREATVIVP